MDNFLWGHLSDRLNQETDLTVERIREKLVYEISELNNNQGVILMALERQVRLYRKCIEQNGGHVEQFSV